MKKQLLLLIFPFIINTFVCAQGGFGSRPISRVVISDMAVIDKANMKFLYAYNATDKSDVTTYDDLQILEIGSKFSKYYSFIVFNRDSLIADWIEKNPQAQSIPNRMGIEGKDPMWSEFYYAESFKDFRTGIFTEYIRPARPYNQFKIYYEEKIPDINWKIENDTTTILGYKCQKASFHFRGRDFVAWFSLDIPVSNGPWKFGGLPGLILKVSDTANLFVFECVEINSKKGQPIRKYNEYKVFKKMDRMKVLELVRKMNSEKKPVTVTTISSFSPPEISIEMQKKIDEDEKKIAARRPYEQLELE